MSSKEIVEDQGRKLRDILISKDTFKQSYLVRSGEREGGRGVREGGKEGGRQGEGGFGDKTLRIHIYIYICVKQVHVCVKQVCIYSTFTWRGRGSAKDEWHSNPSRVGGE